MSRGFNYRSGIFLVLWIVNFLLTFSFNLIPTSRAYLTKAFVGNVQTATVEALGILLSLGSAAATVGYFAGGFASDSMGRKRVVILSFVILALGCALFIVAPNLNWLYLANFIEYFGAGFSSPAISALVADCSELGTRGTAFGIFNLSWVASGVAAPLLAGSLAQFVSLYAPFLLALLVSVAGLFVSYWLKAEGKNERGKTTVERGEAEKVDSASYEGFRRIILIFCVTNILNGLMNGFVNPVLNGMLLFKLAAAPALYGLVLSLSSSLVTGIVQVPGGKLTDRFGRKPLALFGFLAAPLVVLLGFSGSLLEFSLVLGGISALGNISSPAISAWLMDLVPEQKRASASGITQTLNGVGLTVGPNLGSYAWNATSPDAVIPCGIAAFIFVAGLPFYLMVQESKTAPHGPNVP